MTREPHRTSRLKAQVWSKSLLIMIYHTVSKQTQPTQIKLILLPVLYYQTCPPNMFTGHGEAVECDGADVAGLAGSADATL